MASWKTVTKSQADTEKLAAELGRRLKGGEVIELVSDLGGGKTAFVRGLARGLGSKDLVGSPTFTISREYKAGDKTLYHFDFYRLGEPGIMTDELSEILDDPKSIVAVEWSDIVQQVLPEKRVTINFKIIGDKNRELIFAYPAELDYLLDGFVPPMVEKQNKKRNSK